LYQKRICQPKINFNFKKHATASGTPSSVSKSVQKISQALYNKLLSQVDESSKPNTSTNDTDQDQSIASFTIVESPSVSSSVAIISSAIARSDLNPKIELLVFLSNLIINFNTK